MMYFCGFSSLAIFLWWDCAFFPVKCFVKRCSNNLVFECFNLWTVVQSSNISSVSMFQCLSFDAQLVFAMSTSLEFQP